MGDEREINPFFLPALILAAFLPVGFLCGGIVTFFDVYPCEMHFDKIHFYYSENKENFEIFKRLDSLDRLSRSKELGVMYLHADFDCFAEQKQLEQIYDKAINEARTKQREVFWENFTPVIPLGLCIFVIGFFFTRLLVKIQWYVLLYVVDIVGMGVIFFGLPFFLCH